MFSKKPAYCLVLAGGGAKGVYHIGAWKALQEMDIKVNAFIGNSIGAIIAGFLAQGEYKKLEEIGHNIGLDFIINMPQEFIENGEFNLTTSKQLSGFKSFFQTTRAKKGLDTGPLQKLLKTNLSETRIRATGNDLGVATYSLTDMKPKEVYIEDMEEGRLIDYLLASSAFPGFEQPEIAGKKYIDGGVFDNVPYTMAQQRGYKRIIVIDISGLGVKRKLNVDGGQIIYVKNSINMGGVLDFNKEFLENFTKLGYLDTLRTFDRLEGHNYFIVPNEKIENQFKKKLGEPEYQQKIVSFVDEFLGKHELTFSLSLKTLFPEHSRFEKKWLSVFFDCTALSLDIERVEKWEYPQLFAEIKTKLDELHHKLDELEQQERGHFETIIRDIIAEKKFTEAPYYYYLLIDRFISGKTQKLLKKGFFALSPEYATGHIFISEMAGFWND